MLQQQEVIWTKNIEKQQLELTKPKEEIKDIHRIDVPSISLKKKQVLTMKVDASKGSAI